MSKILTYALLSFCVVMHAVAGPAYVRAGSAFERQRSIVNADSLDSLPPWPMQVYDRWLIGSIRVRDWDSMDSLRRDSVMRGEAVHYQHGHAVDSLLSRNEHLSLLAWYGGPISVPYKREDGTEDTAASTFREMLYLVEYQSQPNRHIWELYLVTSFTNRMGAENIAVVQLRMFYSSPSNAQVYAALDHGEDRPSGAEPPAGSSSSMGSSSTMRGYVPGMHAIHFFDLTTGMAAFADVLQHGVCVNNWRRELGEEPTVFFKLH